MHGGSSVFPLLLVLQCDVEADKRAQVGVMSPGPSCRQRL